MRKLGDLKPHEIRALFSRPKCRKGQVRVVKIKVRRIKGDNLPVFDIEGEEKCINPKKYKRKWMTFLIEVGGRYYLERALVYCHPKNGKPLYLSAYTVDKLLGL